MKGYTIINSLTNQPLYICFSKVLANKMMEEIDMPSHLRETPLLGNYEKIYENAEVLIFKLDR